MRMQTFMTAAATGALLLAGCSGQPEAKPSTPVARPTAVTASPSSTPTTTAGADAAALAAIPKKARPHTYPAAQAFAEFYVGQFNTAFGDPDPEALRPYGAPTCKSCAALVGSTAGMLEIGERYRGNVVTVRTGAWLPESKPSLAVVDVIADQHARPVVDRNGKTVRVEEATKVIWRCYVGWTSKGWQMSEMKNVRGRA